MYIDTHISILYPYAVFFIHVYHIHILYIYIYIFNHIYRYTYIYIFKLCMHASVYTDTVHVDVYVDVYVSMSTLNIRS